MQLHEVPGDRQPEPEAQRLPGRGGVLLPESIEFLIGKGKGDILPKVNGILGRMGHPAATVLPARAVDARPSRVTDIFVSASES